MFKVYRLTCGIEGVTQSKYKKTTLLVWSEAGVRQQAQVETGDVQVT